VTNVVVVRQQRLSALVQFGVNLYGLWLGALMRENAEAGRKAQTRQRQYLIARG